MNLVNQETGEMFQIPLQSGEINELAKAMAKAQGAMTAAKMDGSNPHYRSNYATLDSIWTAARKPLSDNGLSVVQQLLPDGILLTTLMHESGQWMKSYLKLNPIKNDPQGVGSALTYGRRQAFAAMVGIAQADDDAEGATGQNGSKPVQPAQPPVPASQWLPTKEEFFGQVETELKITEADAKAILKADGYNGFAKEKAGEMYKAIQKELRIRKEAGKIQSQASGQPELMIVQPPVIYP